MRKTDFVEFATNSPCATPRAAVRRGAAIKRPTRLATSLSRPTRHSRSPGHGPPTWLLPWLTLRGCPLYVYVGLRYNAARAVRQGQPRGAPSVRRPLQPARADTTRARKRGVAPRVAARSHVGGPWPGFTARVSRDATSSGHLVAARRRRPSRALWAAPSSLRCASPHAASSRRLGAPSGQTLRLIRE